MLSNLMSFLQNFIFEAILKKFKLHLRLPIIYYKAEKNREAVITGKPEPKPGKGR